MAQQWLALGLSCYCAFVILFGLFRDGFSNVVGLFWPGLGMVWIGDRWGVFLAWFGMVL